MKALGLISNGRGKSQTPAEVSFFSFFFGQFTTHCDLIITANCFKLTHNHDLQSITCCVGVISVAFDNCYSNHKSDQ